MAIGEWKQLASADIAQVTPSVEPGGYYSARIDAWNGFAADVTNNIVYLGGVGGHGDYAGNEVYALDLDAASPQWVLQMQPSPSSAYLVDQPYYSDGKPSATHTYYTTWFIEQRGKFFRFAGAATWGSGNGSTRYIDSWNPQTKAWDPKDTNPQLGTAPIYEMPTAKDYVTGDVYQLQGNNRLYRWNQATNTVTDLGNAGGGGGSFYELEASPSVVDTKNGRLLFLSDTANPGKIRVYDLAAKTWSTVTPTGAAASSITKAHSQGMAYYDYCSDKIVVTTGQGGTIYLLDPVTFAATTMPTSGSAPPNPVNGAHTLFQMLPKLGGYAYQPRHSSKMYFLATQ